MPGVLARKWSGFSVVIQVGRGPHNALLPPSRIVDRLVFLQLSGTGPCMFEGRVGKGGGEDERKETGVRAGGEGESRGNR